MKANLSEDGVLIVTPETPAEARALEMWEASFQGAGGKLRVNKAPSKSKELNS